MFPENSYINFGPIGTSNINPIFLKQIVNYFLLLEGYRMDIPIFQKKYTVYNK
jgi:hypothetical protein